MPGPCPQKETSNWPRGLQTHRLDFLHHENIRETGPLPHQAQSEHIHRPLQFVYHPNIGVDDALIYLLQRVYAHLDTSDAVVRIMFFDFSSAFNTIQPELLGEKLRRMQVESVLVSWVLDYLTARPQYVRLQDCVSETVLCSTGAPQGTVLSPFLFTLYTSDFQRNSDSCFLQKFSDDSAVVGCVRGGCEGEYRDTIREFITWSNLNHLRLNISKTKEMVLDFRRRRPEPDPVSIQGTEVELVSHYKYLGVVLISLTKTKRKYVRQRTFFRLKPPSINNNWD
ncbi:putative RNA-directed DNA polymerase from transposon X-element [Merluccius polli]|uniref:RNA-directed DNA polymerase from transposon X-element n=1 Tax=Merluccius polli TaxID=89951 RepID=A0AA47NRL3_MERPO|nr:putative RNA-directed DNA polymerase from transposon X-element [Merluccius polli]